MAVQQRSIIARALMMSAIIMGALAIVFRNDQPAVAGALAVVAIVDGLLGYWFSRSQ